MPNLAIMCPDAEAYQAYIGQRLPELEISIAPTDDPSAAKAVLRKADFLLVWKFPPGLLVGASRLRWAQSFGAGVDHLLDAEIPASVVVTRVVDVFSAAMAEYVLGYSYATRLNLRRFGEQQRRAEWAPVNPTLLSGSTAVVVGLGSIGREVCRLFRAAGLRVLGVSRSGESIPDVGEALSVAELDHALPVADFLVLVLPLTSASRGLIDARRLALLPAGAWLMNIARGPIVVESDLLAALRGGRLGGAVLDVFEQEPLPRDHPFWGMENVFVTPHIAGPDDTSIVAQYFVDNYRRYEAGEPLLGVVDLQRGY